MNTPKRYLCAFGMEGVMQPFERGDWVTHADYLAMLDQRDAALMVAESGNALVKQLKDQLAEAKAENERLRKAGDNVALDYAERLEIEAGQTAETLLRTLPVLKAWLAAKGVQS